MKPTQLSTKELIERIARSLPKEIAEDYYREMLYCYSLPDSDEILRILRVMQILTLIMDRIPSRVMEEREAIERLFREAAQALKMVLSSSELFHKQLDLRLSRLPAAIAEGIRPEAIAATINESLHQQFVASTIPQTAQALAVIAEQMKKVSSEFSSTASHIGSSYLGAAEQARRAIDNIRTSVTQAGNAAQQTTEELVCCRSARIRRSQDLIKRERAVQLMRVGPSGSAFRSRSQTTSKLLQSRAVVVLCQEDAKASCCTRDEGRSFGVAL